MNLINIDLNYIIYFIIGLFDVLVIYVVKWVFLGVLIRFCNNILIWLDDLKDNLEEVFVDWCYNISGIFVIV